MSALKKSTPMDDLTNIIQTISKISGNQFGEKQQRMIESRLSKRCTELGLASLEEYSEYFQKNSEKETEKLVSVLTTHHTYFFREFTHFEYIQNSVLPTLIERVKKRGDKTIRIWCAASSRGHEIYSLAMWMTHLLQTKYPDIRFDILGTDIDSESVAFAKNGVFKWEELKEAPLYLLGQHWARGTGEIADFVKAKKSLRDHCRFEVKNLLDSKLDSVGKFDLIFCRNVFIYFNPEQIKSITTKLIQNLQPESWFFVGISESLHSLKLPIKNLGPSVYTNSLAVISGGKKETKVSATAAPAISPAKPLRVLCVDDSPTILTLLKQVLTKDSGFEIVATAKNGIEAAEQLRKYTVDVMTLDIHMPEMTGIEYLEKNFKKGHPPVVMVTSVSREDSSLAGQALKLGAADYIEKPSMQHLKERTEEIRLKLKCAVQAASFQATSDLSLDQSMQRKEQIPAPEKKLKVIVGHFSERGKLAALIQQWNHGLEPNILVLIEGAGTSLKEMGELLSKDCGKTVTAIETLPTGASAGQIWIGDFQSCLSAMHTTSEKTKTTVIALGAVSLKTLEALQKSKSLYIIAEETKENSVLMGKVQDMAPFPSLASMADDFLCKK